MPGRLVLLPTAMIGAPLSVAAITALLAPNAACTLPPTNAWIAVAPELI